MSDLFIGSIKKAVWPKLLQFTCCHVMQVTWIAWCLKVFSAVFFCVGLTVFRSVH